MPWGLLSVLSQVGLVNGGTFGAGMASETAADHDADGKANSQPKADVSGEDTAAPMPAPSAMPRPICVDTFFMFNLEAGSSLRSE
jgi:hypothetical protein